MVKNNDISGSTTSCTNSTNSCTNSKSPTVAREPGHPLEQQPQLPPRQQQPYTSVSSSSYTPVSAAAAIHQCQQKIKDNHCI